MLTSDEQPSSLRTLATGLGFPEGPVVLADGTILVTEISNRQISAVSPSGKCSVFAKTGGGPNGLAIGPDGHFYCCNNGGSIYPPGDFRSSAPLPDYTGGYIQRITPAGKVETIHTHCNGRALSAPNDIVFDKHGGYYFTDLGKRFAEVRGHGGLYYVPADNSKVIEVVYPMLSSNGVGLSPDESTVYVADTETSRLLAYTIVSPGVIKKEPFPSPSHARVVCGLPGFQRFDSLAVDAEGNICVATLITGHITVISPEGKVLRRVKMPGLYTTNIAFGGPGLRTAYITLSDLGHLVAVDWPTAGLALHYANGDGKLAPRQV